MSSLERTQEECRLEVRTANRLVFFDWIIVCNVIKSRAGHIVRKGNKDVPFPYKPDSVVFQV